MIKFLLILFCLPCFSQNSTSYWQSISDAKLDSIAARSLRIVTTNILLASKLDALISINKRIERITNPKNNRILTATVTATSLALLNTSFTNWKNNNPNFVIIRTTITNPTSLIFNGLIEYIAN